MRQQPATSWDTKATVNLTGTISVNLVVLPIVMLSNSERLAEAPPDFCLEETVKIQNFLNGLERYLSDQRIDGGFIGFSGVRDFEFCFAV